MSLPQVVSEDLSSIVSEMIASWEAATDKTLQPAQIERLMVDLIAYREYLLRAAENDAARQNLPQFANETMLTFLGEMFATYRLPANPSRTTLRFSVDTAVTSAFAIPDFPRISAPNGALFAPTTEPVIQAGQTYVDVKAQADTASSANNGFLPGTIKEAFDELPDGVSVENITTSSGGTEIEDLERFRERVLLAMARPSAGSGKAYRYIAMTADARVIDVSVQVVAPGWVRLAVLTDGDPAEVVAAVDLAAQADDVRPLTDRVDTIAAIPVAVAVVATLTPRKGPLLATLQTAAESALKVLQTKFKTTLGYDSVASQVSAALQTISGMKRVVLSGADQPIAPEEYAVLSWTLAFTEAEDD